MMKNKIKKIGLVCIIFIIVFSTIIILRENKNKNGNNIDNLLIGSWESDWRPVSDLNIYVFKEDGTGKELIISKEDGDNVKDIEYLESIAESVINFTYTNYGDYFDMKYIYEGEEYVIRVDYKIENNMLKVEINQAGWTDRQYNKM